MILISLLLFIVAMALPSFHRQITSILFTRIATIVLIYSGALAFNAFYIQSIGSGIGLYSGLFQITTMSQQLDMFLLFIGAFILIPRPAIIEHSTLSLNPNTHAFLSFGSDRVTSKASQSSNSKPNFVRSITRMPISDIASGLGGKYSLIVLFSTLGSLLLISSSDLLSMYLSIELQSFGVYILATLFRDSKLATSAGLKYFLLGGLSSCIILLGAALVYSYTGLSHLDSIYSLISVSNSSLINLNGNSEIHQGLTLGIILIFIGFLFKIAAAPLHNWAPDVYNDSPTIVTIWLTIMPKMSIFIFLLDLFTGSSLPSLGLGPNSEALFLLDLNTFYSQMSFLNSEFIKNLLLLSSLLSLIIGSVVGLAQSKIKRLLAYSTISHIGFILLALSINSEQSIESFIFYILQYSITNLNAFLIILALGYLIKKHHYTLHSVTLKSIQLNTLHPLRGKNSLIPFKSEMNIEEKDLSFISELKGQFLFNPLLSLGLTICLLSMAGTPPLMGFFSKQMVLYSAIQSGYYFMSIIAILVSVISASYYLKIVRTLFTQESKDSQNSQDNQKILAQHEASQISQFENRTLSSHSLNTHNSPIDGEGENGDTIIEYSVSSLHSYLISILSLFILFFILKPSILLNSSQLLSLSLFLC